MIRSLAIRYGVMVVICALFVGSAKAANLGLEGSYLGALPMLDERDNTAPPGDGQPPYVWDTETNFKGSIAPDWYAALPAWIGQNAQHWRLSKELADKTEGEASMKIMVDDEQTSARDIFVGTKFPTVPGVEYHLFFDMKLGDMRGTTGKPHRAQYAVLAGGSLASHDMANIEDYAGHERPGTLKFPSANFGDGLWHTYEYTFTAAGPEASLVVYQRAREGPGLLGKFNLLDNLVVIPEPASLALLLLGGLVLTKRR